MAVNISTVCDQLATEYSRIIGMLSSLPVGGSVSEGGRSISATATELQARLDLITKQAAALGCPIGTMSDPFVITSTARP